MRSIIHLSLSQLFRRGTGLIYMMGAVLAGTEYPEEIAQVIAGNQILYILSSAGLGYGFMLAHRGGTVKYGALLVKSCAAATVLFCLAVPLWVQLPFENVAAGLLLGALTLLVQRMLEIVVTEAEANGEFGVTAGAAVAGGSLGLVMGLLALPLGSGESALVYLCASDAVTALYVFCCRRKTRMGVKRESLGFMAATKAGYAPTADLNAVTALSQLEIIAAMALLEGTDASAYALWSRLFAIPILVVASVLPRVMLAKRDTEVAPAKRQSTSLKFFGLGAIAVFSLAIAGVLFAPLLPTDYMLLGAISPYLLVGLSAGSVAKWYSPYLVTSLMMTARISTRWFLLGVRLLVGAFWLGAAACILHSPLMLTAWPIAITLPTIAAVLAERRRA